MYEILLWIVCDRSNANSSTAHSDIHTTKLLLCSLQRLLHISFTGNLNITDVCELLKAAIFNDQIQEKSIFMLSTFKHNDHLWVTRLYQVTGKILYHRQLMATWQPSQNAVYSNCHFSFNSIIIYTFLSKTVFPPLKCQECYSIQCTLYLEFTRNIVI